MLYNELEQENILSGVRLRLATIAYVDILLCSIGPLHKIRQTPVSTIALLTFGAFQFTGEGPFQVAESAPEKNFTIVRIQLSAGELPAVIKAGMPKAKQLGRKPFVYFYADWCSPCRALRNSLDDPLMIDAFNGTYIIQFDADAWGTRLAGTGFSIRGIPVLFEINNDGKPTGRKIDGGAWGDNIPRNMAPPLKAFFKGSSQKQ